MELENKMNTPKTQEELNKILKEAYRCKPGDLEELLQKIATETYATDGKTSQVEARQKLAVVVGANQIKSVDERVNTVFKEAIAFSVCFINSPNSLLF